MALVITLALLVLLTFVVVAFLSKSQRSRQIETASAGGAKAGELARSAANIIISDLQREIESGSANIGTADNPAFRPNTATNILPENTAGTTGNSSILIKKSGDDFSSDGSPTISASVSTGVPTTTPANNNRTVPLKRWAMPRLLPAATDPPAPEWINIGVNGLTSAANDDVIGRFAFTIYDTSGLIDITQWGSDRPDISTTDPGLPKRLIPFKGHTYYADLHALVQGGADTVFHTQNTGRQWKINFANTDVLTEPDRWVEFLSNWNKTGGLNPAWIQDGADRVHAKHFVGRQDLISGTTTIVPIGTPPANVTGLRGGDVLLPLVTHFSREVNAPSLPYLDATDLGFANANHFAATYTSAHTIPLYRDDGTTTLDDGSAYEIEVKAGDPVLQRRFSLGKLGRVTGYDSSTGQPIHSYWLTPTGPGAGISAAAIRDFFGLAWDSTNERWIYVGAGTSGSTPATVIKTLAQVAAEGRAPDFFEILKAGINPDSLGGRQTLDGGAPLTVSESAMQSNGDLHVLRMGAGIVDQADDNNIPTRIAFGVGGGVVDVAGVERLPYLRGAGIAFDESNERFWIVPLLKDPHRQRTTAIAAPNLRLRFKGGEAVLSNGETVNLPNSNLNLNSDYTSETSLVDGSPTESGSADVNDSNALRVQATTPVGAIPPQITLRDFDITLEYEASPGNWYPYDALAGYPESVNDFSTAIVASAPDPVQFPYAGSALFLKPDPRTTRYGLFSLAGSENFNASADFSILAPPVTTTAGSFNLSDFTQGGTAGVSGGKILNIADRPQDASSDIRVNDGFFGAEIVSSNEIDPARPAILQRPFRNVAEIGHVFRDQPWKSLNFSHEESADLPLLDLFQLSEVEPEAIAGKVNLNTASQYALNAAVRGVGNELSADSLGYSTILGNTPADDIAVKLVAALGDPQLSMADALSSALSNSQVQSTITARLGPVKAQREALARALTGIVQTRTWNLMIDVIAQSGRYPNPGTPSAADFIVEGESRYWIHVGLDRFTGEIVDIQWEAVNE